MKPVRQAGRSGQDEYLYLAYLREYNRGAGRWGFANKLVRKLNGFYFMIFGAYVCNIDLMGGREPCGPHESWTRRIEPKRFETINGQRDESSELTSLRNTLAALTGWLPRPLPRSSWRRSLRMGWISNALAALYAAAFVIVVLNIVYMYKWHLDNMRLDRLRNWIGVYGPEHRVAVEVKLFYCDQLVELEALRARGNSALGINEVELSLGSLERMLEARKNDTQHTLAILGDEYAVWGLVIEIFYQGVLFLGLGVFVILQWLYLFVNPPGTWYHRDYVDSQEESRRVDAYCKTEVIRYLESSQAHSAEFSSRERRLSHKLSTALDHRLYSPLNARRHIAGDDDNSEIMRKYGTKASDYQVCRTLMRLYTIGALRPFNRSNWWTSIIHVVSAWVQSTMIIYCFMFTFYAVQTLGGKNSTSGLNLGGISMCIIIVLNSFSLAFHGAAFIVSSLEQAVLVNQTLDVINACVRLNQQLFETYLRTRGEDDREPRQRRAPSLVQQLPQAERPEPIIVDKINSNYLFALMTYKIFTAQLHQFRRTFRGIYVICYMLAFTVPVLARVHVPYMQVESESGIHRMREWGFVVGLATLIPANAICLPMCYLFARCQSLTRSLASLIAHIIDVEKHDSGIAIYNEHAVRILLKELSDPEEILDRFLVKSLGVDATYQSTLRIHFWWGLVALSLLVDTQDNFKSSLFGSLINDPLGVWSFRLI